MAYAAQRRGGGNPSLKPFGSLLSKFAVLDIHSPLGLLVVVASTQAVVALQMVQNKTGYALMVRDYQREMANRTAINPTDHPVLNQAAQELEEYFAGVRRQFDVPLDRQFSSGIGQHVHPYLSSIPYGQTRTYAQVAAAVNRPGAARAVGTACGSNSIPIIVPCHRVLRSDGTLGGYTAGFHVKRRLLELEGVQVAQMHCH